MFVLDNVQSWIPVTRNGEINQTEQALSTVKEIKNIARRIPKRLGDFSDQCG